MNACAHCDHQALLYLPPLRPGIVLRAAPGFAGCFRRLGPPGRLLDEFWFFRLGRERDYILGNMCGVATHVPHLTVVEVTGELRLASKARLKRGLIVDFVARSATKSTEQLFLRALAERHACSTV